MSGSITITHILLIFALLVKCLYFFKLWHTLKAMPNNLKILCFEVSKMNILFYVSRQEKLCVLECDKQDSTWERNAFSDSQ